MKYAFIARHRAVSPTPTMCYLLGVSASGFYDWLERAPSKREVENQRLLRSIRISYEASDSTYGSPRVVRDLWDQGETCSENRVARLMQKAGIRGRQRRHRNPGQIVGEAHTIAPNLLDRQFEATAPDQKWAADFTYVWTGEGWLFVAVVLDLYSRRAVGSSPEGSAAPQRPGITVYEQRLSEPARSPRHRMQH